MRLKLYKNVYYLSSINNVECIKESIENGKIIHNLYLIYVSKNENNIFDIETMYNVINKKADEKCTVVGFAYERDEAFEIVRKIFEEYVLQNNDIKNIKVFLGGCLPF